MLSLRAFFIIFRLPVSIVWTLLRYYTVGVKSRRYQNSLVNSLKLEVYRSVLRMDIPDLAKLPYITNDFMINKAVPLIHKQTTSQLPGYGTRYHDHGLWIVKQPDRKPQDPLILYLHGGGYFMQTTVEQIESIMAIYKLVKPEKRSKLSIMHLDYTLVTAGKTLPHQLGELHSVYAQLVLEGSNNIILMGDSAGGNLAMGFLQHLKKRVQNPVYPTKLILVSPWVYLNPDHPNFAQGTSYHASNVRDLITIDMFTHKTGGLIFGDVDLTSIEFNPALPPTKLENWDGIPTVNDPNYDVFLIYGEDESFRDDCEQFQQLVLDVPNFRVNAKNSKNSLDRYQYIRENKPNKCNVRVYVEPWGLHDAMLFFENRLLAQLERYERQSIKVSTSSLDRHKYFGLLRAADFLNDTL